MERIESLMGGNDDDDNVEIADDCVYDDESSVVIEFNKLLEKPVNSYLLELSPKSSANEINYYYEYLNNNELLTMNDANVSCVAYEADEWNWKMDSNCYNEIDYDFDIELKNELFEIRVKLILF